MAEIGSNVEKKFQTNPAQKARQTLQLNGLKFNLNLSRIKLLISVECQVKILANVEIEMISSSNFIIQFFFQVVSYVFATQSDKAFAVHELV